MKGEEAISACIVTILPVIPCFVVDIIDGSLLNAINSRSGIIDISIDNGIDRILLVVLIYGMVPDPGGHQHHGYLSCYNDPK